MGFLYFTPFMPKIIRHFNLVSFNAENKWNGAAAAARAVILSHPPHSLFLVINNIAWNNKNYALEKAAEALSQRTDGVSLSRPPGKVKSFQKMMEAK